MPNASSTVPLANERKGLLPAWLTGPRQSVLGIAVVVLLLLSWPTISPNPYMTSAGVLILSYATFATAWSYMGSFTGYISLGHIAFYGLGAYGTALIIMHSPVPSFGAVLVAAAGTAVIAIPVGFAALRLRGSSFVIVTIALILVMQLVFQAWSSVTGGSDGLTVPRPFPDMLRPQHHETFYYIFLALLAVLLLGWTFINHSRFGSALKGIREDEDKAASLGSPIGSLKLVAFVLSAFGVGIVGGLYALWFGDLDPLYQFDVVLSVQIVLMVLLGGLRFLFGPLLGALLIGAGQEYFLLNFGQSQFHLVATGLLLALVVLFLPDGVLTGIQQLINRFRPQSSSIREVSAEELQKEHANTAGGKN